jgi:hypothetical protein
MKIYAPEQAMRQIHSLLGDPSRKGVVGSTVYFVERVVSEDSNAAESLQDHKLIIQLYSRGLLLHAFRSQERKVIPIPYDSITILRLKKGKETVAPRPLSLFAILLRLGMRVEIARYFGAGPGQYQISDTVLQIVTNSAIIELRTSGYTFPSQKHFFTKEEIKSKVEILE